MYKKLIEPFILGVILSFFFFPVGFTFLPASLNNKQILAVLGAFIFMLESIKDRKLCLSRTVFGATFFAFLFSAICYYSTLVNVTSDYTYATYFVSFFVWLAAAYGVYKVFKVRYHDVTIPVITKYLMWVCVAQCIAALLNDNVPIFKSAMGSIFELGSSYLDPIGRKYGIGAALDPAGVRFSIVLVLIAHDLGTRIFKIGHPKEVFRYLFGFFFIVLIGNMISRTTTVGAVIGLAFILWSLGKVKNGVVSYGALRSFLTLSAFLVIAIPIVIYLYNTSASMHSDLRFAFEGFFNWVETGEWRTDSTDKLNSSMWKWPTDTHTWIIGSGIFGFYAFSTDIGYCRFIFYCGLVGLCMFSIFFMYNAYAVNRKFSGVGFLALMLLALTFVVWIKVATDIFQIYALLFCIDAISNQDELEEDEVLPSL